MATTRWIGGTSSDWNTAGNWSNGIPSSGDTLLVDSLAGRDLLLNLDRTGDDGGDGLHLALLHVYADATISIGAVGAPLKLTADEIIVEAPGCEIYFESLTGAGGETTDRIVHRDGLFSYSSPASTGAGILAAEISGGAGTLTLSNGLVSLVHVLQRHPAPIVTINGTTAIPDFFMSGGQVTWSGTGNATRLHLGGGEFTLAQFDLTSVFQTGGIFILDSTTSNAVLEYHGLKGVLDTTRTKGPKSIATLYRDAQSHMLISDPALLTVSEIVLGGVP